MSVLSVSALGCKSKPESVTVEAEPTADIEGMYTIASSRNPGGGSYKGKVAVSKLGKAYAINWTLTRQSYGGVALLRDNVLTVGWGTGTNFGVLVYKIEGKRMIGVWTSASVKGEVGTEILDQEDGSEQKYSITTGKSPNGKSYGGVVSFTPRGDTYAVRWMLSDGTSYKGVGVREGNRMRVGWGTGGGAGLVIYDVAPKKLTGRWATPSGTKLGAEVLKREY